MHQIKPAPGELIKAIGLHSDKTPQMKEHRGRILHYHAVMYILKGKGYFEDTTVRKKVVAGTVFYLFPQKRHKFDPNDGTV